MLTPEVQQAYNEIYDTAKNMLADDPLHPASARNYVTVELNNIHYCLDFTAEIRVEYTLQMFGELNCTGENEAYDENGDLILLAEDPPAGPTE